MIRGIILSVVLVITMINSSFAKTYYVKPTGNNSNSGLTEALAWQTIARACTTLVAGDTVLIMNGTYKENSPSNGFCPEGARNCGPLTPKNSGTASKPIVYKAYPGHRPVISSATAYDDYGISLYGVNYIVIDSLVQTKTYRGILIMRAGYITVKNCKVYDTWSEADYNNGGIFLGFGETADSVYHCIVRACTTYNNFDGGSGWNTGGVYGYFQKDCVIEDNVIYDQSGGSGIRLKGGAPRGNTIRRNTIWDSGIGIAICTDSRNTDCYQNIMYYCNEGISLATDPEDIFTAWIHNNTMYFMYNSGIKLYPTYNVRACSLWNNIAIKCNSGNGHDELTTEANNHPNFWSDYNCWWDNDDNTVILWNGSNNWTLAQFQANTAFDDNSIQSDPLFVDPPTSASDLVWDLHLQSGSPAKGRGKGGLDMGAYPRPDTGASSPHLSINPLSLTFNAVQNGPLPSSQTFTITNSGGGTLNWSISDNATWLGESPTSGNSNSAIITVSVNTTNLTPGTYNAAITISSSNADNSPQVVSVAYIIASQTLTPPVPISPPNGGTIEDTSATLIIRNGRDSLGSTLLHFFQIDSTESFDSPRLKQSFNLALSHPDDTTTAWPVLQGLTWGRIYYWRAFAYTNTNPPYYSAPSSVSNFRIRQHGVAKAIVDIHVSPNPFEPSLNHSYVTFQDIPLNSTIKITTVSGDLVKTFENTEENEVIWDVKNEHQNALASGVYLYYVIHQGQIVASSKLAVVR